MHIRKLVVNNFRSLISLSVGSMNPLTIFYGANDSGKSNILAFLETLFKVKLPENSTSGNETGDAHPPPQRPGVFWRGIIENFDDNFYQNVRDPISFHVFLRYLRRELIENDGLPKEFLGTLPAKRPHDNLELIGEIKHAGGNSARIVLQKVQFNNRLFFERDNEDRPIYLPEIEVEDGQKLDVFDTIMSQLDNGFTVIPANRYLSSEIEIAREDKVELTSEKFKNWLFQKSLDRLDEQIINQLSTQFNAPPFNFGRVTVARVNENKVEIFIEDENGLKLPIGRKGSGVQQILIILAHVAQFQSPMIGIEELEINLSPPSQNVIFNILKTLVDSKSSPISQILLTTHSHQLAKRNDVQRRGVWMDKGITKARRPSEAEMNEFFGY